MLKQLHESRELELSFRKLEGLALPDRNTLLHRSGNFKASASNTSERSIWYPPPPSHLFFSSMADRGVRRRGRGFGARGGFKRTHNTHSEPEDDFEGPEIKQLREKHGESVSLVQAVFPDWDEVSVLYALAEAGGSVELAISRIVEGEKASCMRIHLDMTSLTCSTGRTTSFMVHLPSSRSSRAMGISQAKEATAKERSVNCRDSCRRSRIIYRCSCTRLIWRPRTGSWW